MQDFLINIFEIAWILRVWKDAYWRLQALSAWVSSFSQQTLSFLMWLLYLEKWYHEVWMHYLFGNETCWYRGNIINENYNVCHRLIWYSWRATVSVKEKCDEETQWKVFLDSTETLTFSFNLSFILRHRFSWREIVYIFQILRLVDYLFGLINWWYIIDFLLKENVALYWIVVWDCERFWSWGMLSLCVFTCFISGPLL